MIDLTKPAEQQIDDGYQLTEEELAIADADYEAGILAAMDEARQGCTHMAEDLCDCPHNK